MVLRGLIIFLWVSGYSYGATPQEMNSLAPPNEKMDLSIDETNGGIQESLRQVLRFRDPFRIPVQIAVELEKKGPLLRHPVSSFVLLGVLTSPKGNRAMLRAPDGKTHFLFENDHIGVRDGVVKAIVADGVRIEEEVTDPLGRKKLVETELKVGQAGTISEVNGGPEPKAQSNNSALMNFPGLGK